MYWLMYHIKQFDVMFSISIISSQINDLLKT